MSIIQAIVEALFPARKRARLHDEANQRMVERMRPKPVDPWDYLTDLSYDAEQASKKVDQDVTQ